MFQRRVDDSVYFYRKWADYKNGFGVLSGAFWLGNENIHALTSSGENVLRIDMEDFGGETGYAAYSGFSIDDESTNYTLRFSKMVSSSSNVGKCVSLVLYEITSRLPGFARVLCYAPIPCEMHPLHNNCHYIKWGPPPVKQYTTKHRNADPLPPDCIFQTWCWNRVP